MKQSVIVIPEDMELDKIEDNKIYLKEKKVELPKTWEGCVKLYCRNNPHDLININGCVLVAEPCDVLHSKNFKSILPRGMGDAILALSQLLICRDVYRNGWKPNLEDDEIKHAICYIDEGIIKCTTVRRNCTFSFQSAEIRNEFLENFRDLIEEAKELI